MTAAIAFCFVGTATTLPICILLWSLATSGLYGFIGPFWSMPGRFLSGRAAAVALASICSIGNLAGFAGLAAIGSIAGLPGGLARGFRFIAVSLSLGAALLLAQWYRDTVWAAPKPIYEGH